MDASPTVNPLTWSAPATLVKGARITGNTRSRVSAQVCKRYIAGESIRTLSADLGRSYGFVHRLLVDADVPLRGRGGGRKRR